MCFPCLQTLVTKPKADPLISTAYEMKQIKSQILLTKELIQNSLAGKFFINIECDRKSYQKIFTTSKILDQLDTIFQDVSETFQIIGARVVNIVWIASTKTAVNQTHVVAAGYRRVALDNGRYSCKENSDTFGSIQENTLNDFSQLLLTGYGFESTTHIIKQLELNSK